MNYAIFIVTHGRADNLKTLRTLNRIGVTAPVYLVIDDEDDQEELYRQTANIAGVLKFCKQKYMDLTDTLDNFGKRGAVVYARHAVYDLAKENNIERFIVLDDDYNTFGYRQVQGPVFKHMTFKSGDGKTLEKIFEVFFEYLDIREDIKTVCMAQGGDFIGGKDGFFKKGLARKAMNIWFCRADRPIDFIGTINEDVNAYVTGGAVGELYFTNSRMTVDQTDTQASDGGLTELYLDLGTYIKSFYSVICSPSNVQVYVMGDGHIRIHHRIEWNAVSPQILSPNYKK